MGYEQFVTNDGTVDNTASSNTPPPEIIDESLGRPFQMPVFTDSQKNAFKSSLINAPSREAADANINKFLLYMDDELLPPDDELRQEWSEKQWEKEQWLTGGSSLLNEILDIESWVHKLSFLMQLFGLKLRGSTDPPGSTELYQAIRDYQGALQIVLDMKFA